MEYVKEIAGSEEDDKCYLRLVVASKSRQFQRERAELQSDLNGQQILWTIRVRLTHPITFAAINMPDTKWTFTVEGCLGSYMTNDK